MKVSMLSTWNAACGVAGYTADLRAALGEIGVETEIVEIDRSETKYMSVGELHAHFGGLVDRLASADVVHVQHEFGFFRGAYGYGVATSVFAGVLRQLALRRKPTSITLHTEPVGSLSSDQGVLEIGYNALNRFRWRVQIPPLLRLNRTAVVVHTRTSRRAAIESGIPLDRIRMIRLGVPELTPRRPLGAREAARQRLGFADDETVLALFGFLEPYKGYTTALRALSLLPSRYRLMIIGGVHPHGTAGVLEKILRAIEREGGLRDRVTVHGYVPAAELADYQLAADLCLAPYRSGTPLSSSAALTWALTSGRPVIASAIAAFTELNEVSGALELVAPDAPHELARAIERVTTDPARVHGLVTQATAYSRRHSWRVTAEKHRDMYEELARARRRAGRRADSRANAARAGAAAADAGLPAAGHRRSPAFNYKTLDVFEQPVVFAYPAGTKDQLTEFLINRGRVDETGVRLMTDLVQRDDVVLDLGAHLGTYSLAAAAAGCRVIAIEADPANAEPLQAAADANGFDAITVVQAAAGAAVGSASFLAAGAHGRVVAPDSPAGRRVPMITVDGLLEQLAVDRVDLVKMDIEGSEFEAVAGAETLLSAEDAPPILFETNAVHLQGVGGVDYRDLHRRLEDLGYTLYLIDPVRIGCLRPVQAGDLMPAPVLEHLAVKRWRWDIHPWWIGEPLSEDELVQRLEETSREHSTTSRAFAASLVAAGPEWLRNHPGGERIADRLRRDESSEVRAALSKDQSAAATVGIGDG